MCTLGLDTQEALSSAGQLGEAEDSGAQEGQSLVPGDEIVQPGPLSLHQLHFSG